MTVIRQTSSRDGAADETRIAGGSSDSACWRGVALVEVTWVAISWAMLGAEVMFAVWAWRYSSAPLAAAVVVVAGLVYFDRTAVPLHTLGFVALFLVPVPFLEHWITLRRGRIESEDPLERRDDERHDRIPAIDEYFDQHLLVMRGLGFRHAGDFVETVHLGDVTILTYTRLFNGSDLRERATLRAVLRRGERRHRVDQRSLTFVSRRENGDHVATTNARTLFPFDGAREQSAAFPRKRAAAELLAVHRARLVRSDEAAARQPTPHDWLEESCALRRADFAALSERGYVVRLGESTYRLTWRGAFRLSVSDCPVLRPFVALAIRRRETRLLAMLTASAPAPDIQTESVEPPRIQHRARA
jgi:hypothetical protein